TLGAHAFSVAQHTLLVDDVVRTIYPDMPPAERLALLLHDAPEYVIGDMISPFKALVGGEYAAIEGRLLQAIHRRFGIPYPRAGSLTARIKAADRVAAFYEATRLAGFGEAEARRFFGRPRGVDPARLDLEPWPAKKAERSYLARFARAYRAAGT